MIMIVTMMMMMVIMMIMMMVMMIMMMVVIVVIYGTYRVTYNESYSPTYSDILKYTYKTNHLLLIQTISFLIISTKYTNLPSECTYSIVIEQCW